MKFRVIGFIALLSLILSFQSCATYKTVAPSQQRLIIEQVETLEGEECVSIPRVYSGVCYSFCIMANKVRLKSDHSDIASLPFDLVADTALLPYTICRQIFDGNLVLKKKSH